MADWDDSDGEDAWDVDSDDDDILEARLNKLNVGDTSQQQPPKFDDEEDLAVKEKERNQKLKNVELKTKGNALVEKKKAEMLRKEEEEIARKAMELEGEHEANMTADERRQLEKRRLEEADNDLLDDFLGGSSSEKKSTVSSATTTNGGNRIMKAGDDVELKDLKDHLKHARKIGKCVTAHKKVHLVSAFLKEVIQESKDVLDDDAITDIIKTCNVIKNEKVAAAKKKVKGQAQKSKKNKAAEEKARKLQDELYGDNNDYDEYDDIGDDFEDDYF